MNALVQQQRLVGLAGDRVIEINPRDDPRWEAFVAGHPNGLIYHHPAWLQVLEEVYGYRPVCLAYEKADGQLGGVLPLFHTRGWLTGSRLSSLPHTPVAGPLAHDAVATTALVRAAVERVRTQGSAHLQLKTATAELDGVEAGVVGGPWRASYVLQLPTSPAALRFGNARNHSRIKWAVNKADRVGVQVRQAETLQELRAWYRLYLDTMRWHGLPPAPYRFFEVAWEQLQPQGLLRLVLAEQSVGGQTKLLAGSLFLMFGQTVFYAFNGRRREALALRPNDAIHWQAIHDAQREGYRSYDFGEVAEGNEGLAEFKSKWGSEEQWLYRYYYPSSCELESGAFDQRSRSRRLAKAVWRRLPLRATAVLGSRLYRSL